MEMKNCTLAVGEWRSGHSVWEQTEEDGSARKDGVVNNDCSELRP